MGGAPVQYFFLLRFLASLGAECCHLVFLGFLACGRDSASAMARSGHVEFASMV